MWYSNRMFFVPRKITSILYRLQMTFSEKNIYNQVCVRVCVCVCVFFSLSRLFSSPSFSLSLLVVTQIRRHIAGSSFPSHLRFVQCIFIARRFHQNFFARRLASNCAYPRATRSAVDPFFFFSFLATIFLNKTLKNRQLLARPIEWLKLNFASCAVHQTRSLDVLILYFI